MPDVVLHGDQGVYYQNGSQLPFRSGPRSYVLACWIPLRRSHERMVVVDERFRCGGATLAELLHEGQAADGRGYRRARALPIHPARFLPDLARFCIGLATEPGDVVFDPCAGSMTTLAAATEMGRYAIGCEREREYVLGGRGRLAG